jgi:hypothetical protein
MKEIRTEVINATKANAEETRIITAPTNSKRTESQRLTFTLGKYARVFRLMRAKLFDANTASCWYARIVDRPVSDSENQLLVGSQYQRLNHRTHVKMTDLKIGLRDTASRRFSSAKVLAILNTYG